MTKLTPSLPLPLLFALAMLWTPFEGPCVQAGETSQHCRATISAASHEASHCPAAREESEGQSLDLVAPYDRTVELFERRCMPFSGFASRHASSHSLQSLHVRLNN